MSRRKQTAPAVAFRSQLLIIVFALHLSECYFPPDFVYFILPAINKLLRFWLSKDACSSKISEYLPIFLKGRYRRLLLDIAFLFTSSFSNVVKSRFQLRSFAFLSIRFLSVSGLCRLEIDGDRGHKFWRYNEGRRERSRRNGGTSSTSVTSNPRFHDTCHASSPSRTVNL